MGDMREAKSVKKVLCDRVERGSLEGNLNLRNYSRGKTVLRNHKGVCWCRVKVILQASMETEMKVEAKMNVKAKVRVQWERKRCGEEQEVRSLALLYGERVLVQRLASRISGL